MRRLPSRFPSTVSWGWLLYTLGLHLRLSTHIQLHLHHGMGGFRDLYHAPAGGTLQEGGGTLLLQSEAQKLNACVRIMVVCILAQCGSLREEQVKPYCSVRPRDTSAI